MNTNEPFIVEFQGETLRRFVLRFPGPASWKARVKAQKIERRVEGGKTRQKIGQTRDLDLKTIESCLIEGPETYDEFDAECVLDCLAKCIVGESELVEPNQYRIHATVFGKEQVSVVLKTPSRRQVVNHHDETVDQYSVRGGSATIVTVEPTVKLFSALIVSSEGYAAEIPIPHMDIYLQELLMLCDPNV